MLFFPLPGTYAVIELDVRNSLRALDDSVADAAGALLTTTKCLVYLQAVLQLPFPDSPTFKYSVYVVGPGLRPPNPELCLTPDMSIPIHPSTDHPSGTRNAVVTEPPFPFTSCYHWYGRDMQFDIRILNDGRDYKADPRVALPPIQQVRLESMRGEDMWKSICASRERGEQSPPGGANRNPEDLQETPIPASDALAQNSRDVAPSKPVHIGKVDDSNLENRRESGFEESSEGSCWDSSSSCSFDTRADETNDPESSASLDELGPRIFGFRSSGDDDLLPIVKIWLDLEAHIDGGNVPDPVDFIQQRDELIGIIRESKARAAAVAASSDFPKSNSATTGCSVMKRAFFQVFKFTKSFYCL
ncbi:hypothetical protein C8Q70DRAFT_1059400 [Cubamyces menziesii]|uniref:Uncharacterized protein n=1 Tax=Trametes cubensis TaxID=1111947 RepID=A0AAD7X6X5_9APHY|nr:hypothetical protein C8Q70DRAFT_1059400 [Cubamyces menziesii]KAJ8462576.1 hypothetical protein ONZ51_g10811 [Trametes cubensis]